MRGRFINLCKWEDGVENTRGAITGNQWLTTCESWDTHLFFFTFIFQRTVPTSTYTNTLTNLRHWFNSLIFPGALFTEKNKLTCQKDYMFHHPCCFSCFFLSTVDCFLFLFFAAASKMGWRKSDLPSTESPSASFYRHQPITISPSPSPSVDHHEYIVIGS